VLLAMVTGQQSVRYVEITEANPAQEGFAWGWQAGGGCGLAGLGSETCVYAPCGARLSVNNNLRLTGQLGIAEMRNHQARPLLRILRIAWC
jgi:hypothetical protein